MHSDAVKTIPHLARPKLNEEKDAFRPVKDGLPQVPFVSLLVGSLGSGKTSVMCELVQLLDQGNSIDVVFYFSPTAHLDGKSKLLIEGKHNYKIRTFPDFTMQDWRSCVEETEAGLEKWRDYKRLSKVWAKFVRAGYDPDKLPLDEAMALYELDFQKPEPPFKHGLTPSWLFIFDDLVGNRELYSAAPRGEFSKWLLQVRHRKSSVLFLSQVYQGGLAKQLRANVNLYII